MLSRFVPLQLWLVMALLSAGGAQATTHLSHHSHDGDFGYDSTVTAELLLRRPCPVCDSSRFALGRSPQIGMPILLDRDRFSGTQKFTGKERDAETGLDYFEARYLSSAQGRFTSPDAPFADQHIGDPQSWNLYSYVRNNPLRYTDPTGRCLRPNETLASCGDYLIGGAKAIGNIPSDIVNAPNRLTNLLISPFTDFQFPDLLPSTFQAANLARVSGTNVVVAPTLSAARTESSNACVFCGQSTQRTAGPVQSNIDHAIPKSCGGNNTLNNAQNACRTCNLDKGTRTTQEYQEELRRRTGGN